MPKARLSVVILTKNAQDRIRDCLESVKWADEIVIVDGYSSDSTLEICKEYTNKIIQSEFKGFADERNLGIDNATGDWILQLDADEIVTEPLREAIEKILALSASPVKDGHQPKSTAFPDGVKYVCYKFRRKNYFLGCPMRYGGWYHYSAHFFRKGRARYEGLVHERLKFIPLDSKHLTEFTGEQGRLEAEVEHRPFDSIAQFISRQNRYTDYEAKDMLSEKGKISERQVKYNLYIKPLKLFWKLYIKKQGFRDGMLGFIFSAMNSFVHFLRWAKYWELTYGKRSEQGNM
ncbi:MAG: glycosyltransferase family 2 protein [Candidatus Omnitrophota bacterium]